MAHIHDKLFKSLANEHRRRILFSLLEGPTLISIDSPPDSSRERRVHRIEQQHIHLPELADYGFIRWTPGTNAIEEGSRFEEIRPLLELLDDHRDQLTPRSA